MQIDEQVKQYRALDHWFTTPQGSRVAEAFLEELTPHVFRGGMMIQLGACGENIWLPHFKYDYRWIVNPCVVLKKTSLQSSLLTLPLDRDSVDCVVAPLTMEAFSREKHPLDEIDRVLKPMGYLIIFGINPFSFWGLALKMHHLKCFGRGPVHLFSSIQVKHMLVMRGFSLRALTSFYYIPPFSSESWIRKLEFLNEMGKMIWPYPAGFYCIIAQKYQACGPNVVSKKFKENLLLQDKSTLLPIGP